MKIAYLFFLCVLPFSLFSQISFSCDRTDVCLVGVEEDGEWVTQGDCSNHPNVVLIKINKSVTIITMIDDEGKTTYFIEESSPHNEDSWASFNVVSDTGIYSSIVFSIKGEDEGYILITPQHREGHFFAITHNIKAIFQP